MSPLRGHSPALKAGELLTLCEHHRWATMRASYTNLVRNHLLTHYNPDCPGIASSRPRFSPAFTRLPCPPSQADVSYPTRFIAPATPALRLVASVPWVLAASAALACAPAENWPLSSIQAEAGSRIPTVVSILWQVEDSTSRASRVQYGYDESYGITLEGEALGGGLYSATLLGLSPATEYHYGVLMDIDGQTYSSRDFTFQTGAVPNSIPELAGSLEASSAPWDGYVVTTLISSQRIPLILNGYGEPVWWYIHTNQHSDDDHYTTRARLAHNGNFIVFNSYNWIPNGAGRTSTESKLVFVSLDGEYSWIFETPNGHHDFTELPDGSWAYLTVEYREVNGELVRGDGVAELHPDGSVQQVWLSWDHIDTYKGLWSDETLVLPRCNALEYDPRDDSYLLSFRDMGSLIKIDRATGELLWILGGSPSDFEMLDGSSFHMQHQFDLLDDGLVLFDNGAQTEMSSRAVQLELDYQDMTAENVWSFSSDPDLYTYAMGDATRLPDGSTMVAWGSAGQLDVVAESGQLLSRLNLEIGAGLCFLQWKETLY